MCVYIPSERKAHGVRTRQQDHHYRHADGGKRLLDGQWRLYAASLQCVSAQRSP